MLHRAGELSVKAATGTLTDDDRALIDLEVQQIKDEIDSTAKSTVFNEIRLFPDDGIRMSSMQADIYYYDLTYNPADGTFSVVSAENRAMSAGGVTGRAAVNPTQQGGALADLIAAEMIPKAAEQIMNAFPAIKADIGNITLNIAVKVQGIDGRDGTLAQAYFRYKTNGGRPTVQELYVDNQDFAIYRAES